MRYIVYTRGDRRRVRRRNRSVR